MQRTELMGKEELGGLGQVWSYLGAWTEPGGGCGQLSSSRLGIFILKEVGSCDHQRRLSGPSVAQGSVHREWQLRRGDLPICNSRTCHFPIGTFEGAHRAQASSDPAGDSPQWCIRCVGTWLPELFTLLPVVPARAPHHGGMDGGDRKSVV